MGSASSKTPENHLLAEENSWSYCLGLSKILAGLVNADYAGTETQVLLLLRCFFITDGTRQDMGLDPTNPLLSRLNNTNSETHEWHSRDKMLFSFFAQSSLSILTVSSTLSLFPD